MKILITGATGFLGKHLNQYLSSLGHEITGVNSKNCNLRNSNSLDQFNDISFDQIYHLAAWTQAGDFCLSHPGEQWIINQQINTNVLSWWKENQPQAKLICAGTSCSYAEGSNLCEEEHLKNEPIDSLYTYAMTKRMLYIGLRSLHKQFGLSYLYVVPSTLYGSEYHTDGRQLHFIFDLIRKILLGKYSEEKVSLWGSGFQKRELVLVSDFVKIMTQLALTQHNDIVNIGAGEEYTIREFAQRICDEVNFDHEKIEYDTSKYVGAKSKCLSIKKLEALMPSLSFTPLEKGLSQTISWFKKNMEAMKTA